MADMADLHTSLAGYGTLTGVALSASSGGACLAQVAGQPITVRTVVGVAVATGNVLIINRRGSSYFVVGVVQAAPAIPATLDPLATPPPSDPSPPPKPTITTGTLTCTPVSTSTYRDGSWRSDIGSVNSADTFQGRYAGSSFGQNSGYAFYGSKPHTINGATCTKITLHARRLSSGSFSAQAPTLSLVTQTTRPGGAPTLNETTGGPSLAVNATTTSFTLPNSWGQALINGTRGGIGMVSSSDNPYIQWAGRGTWSGAWVLVISWRR
jgi:hypothetical protein